MGAGATFLGAGAAFLGEEERFEALFEERFEALFEERFDGSVTVRSLDLGRMGGMTFALGLATAATTLGLAAAGFLGAGDGKSLMRA